MGEPEKVPKVAILDGFIEAVKNNEDISLEQAGAGRTLIVETEHSTYTITILDSKEKKVSVTGGRCFSTIMENCILSGATLGGSVIRVGWIVLGACMEFHKPDSNERIITSFVKSISLPGTESKFVH